MSGHDTTEYCGHELMRFTLKVCPYCEMAKLKVVLQNTHDKLAHALKYEGSLDVLADRTAQEIARLTAANQRMKTALEKVVAVDESYWKRHWTWWRVVNACKQALSEDV